MRGHWRLDGATFKSCLSAVCEVGFFFSFPCSSDTDPMWRGVQCLNPAHTGAILPSDNCRRPVAPLSPRKNAMNQYWVSVARLAASAPSVVTSFTVWRNTSFTALVSLCNTSLNVHRLPETPLPVHSLAWQSLRCCHRENLIVPGRIGGPDSAAACCSVDILLSRSFEPFTFSLPRWCAFPSERRHTRVVIEYLRLCSFFFLSLVWVFWKLLKWQVIKTVGYVWVIAPSLFLSSLSLAFW